MSQADPRKFSNLHCYKAANAPEITKRSSRMSYLGVTAIKRTHSSCRVASIICVQRAFLSTLTPLLKLHLSLTPPQAWYPLVYSLSVPPPSLEGLHTSGITRPSCVCSVFELFHTAVFSGFSHVATGVRLKTKRCSTVGGQHIAYLAPMGGHSCARVSVCTCECGHQRLMSSLNPFSTSSFETSVLIAPRTQK